MLDFAPGECQVRDGGGERGRAARGEPLSAIRQLGGGLARFNGNSSSLDLSRMTPSSARFPTLRSLRPLVRQPAPRRLGQLGQRARGPGALGQRVEEHRPVGLGQHPLVQDDDHAPVGLGADQAAKALAEAQDRLRDGSTRQRDCQRSRRGRQRWGRRARRRAGGR